MNPTIDRAVNSTQLNHLRSPLVPVYRLKIKCPICGKPDNCSIREDRTAVFCRRVQSDRPGHNGWMHVLSDTSPPPRPIKRPQPATFKEAPRATVEHCDAVYTVLVYKFLVLSREHEVKLSARGLDPVTIRVNGYVSTPTPVYAANVARALAAKYNLEGVPGFYRESGRWRIVRMNQGILIPVRDGHGRIVGLMIRRDDATGSGKYVWLSSRDRDGGASSGAPANYANPHKLREAKEIIITEGALKADVIACLTGSPVIGIAGISAFSADFAANLREACPNLRRIAIAYDKDLIDKIEVYGALMRLTAQLEQARFQVRIRTWPGPTKGYDDFLLSELTGQEVQAA